MTVVVCACVFLSATLSRWSDEILEGFLYSTLVDGTGLVLDKLDSDGKGKKSGVSGWTLPKKIDPRSRERHIKPPMLWLA